MTTPRTAAGRALNDKYLTGADDYAPFTDDILAIEAEARAAALDEARAAVQSADDYDGEGLDPDYWAGTGAALAAIDALRERS